MVKNVLSIIHSRCHETVLPDGIGCPINRQGMLTRGGDSAYFGFHWFDVGDGVLQRAVALLHRHQHILVQKAADVGYVYAIGYGISVWVDKRTIAKFYSSGGSIPAVEEIN